ncbi:hypothetical protein BC830DRAFT_302458 [Chytriomyces sp. MP71]|nr:hypothetical protein BC830DRAFT_302458 [Chytriomyces sp. MP71]
MTTLGAGAVVAEPDEYESLGGNQHPCNRHLDQQGKRVGSFSKVSDLPPGTLRPSSVTSQRSTPVQSTSAVVTTPKQKRGDSERLDDVLSGISHENSSAAVTKMVADFKSASLVEKISESARNSPRLVKSGPFGGTGYASISVFLVESWFWGDIQKGGEREILLLDLKESETITFSRGERFEVTLPEGILPTVKATNIQTSHKLLIRFSYINLAFSALPSTCTAEINFRIAAFSRRDLDLLLSNERLLSPDILKILPEGYCGRKLAERKRRESIESLRGVFASASMPNLMPKLAVKGGEGAVAMPSGFGVLNATRPSTAEEGIFVATVGMTGQGSRVNFMPILSEGNVPAASGVPKGTGVVGLGLKGGSGDSPSSWSKLKGVGGFGMFRKK